MGQKNFHKSGRCVHCHLKCETPPPIPSRGISYARVDPCLGLLPGVAHACCGHGGKGKAYTPYVAFGDFPGQHMYESPRKDDSLYGESAVAFFESLQVGPTLLQ